MRSCLPLAGLHCADNIVVVILCRFSVERNVLPLEVCILLGNLIAAI